MSSSSGREKLRSRGPRVFAFGSSTPREFSQMTKVSSKSRGVDANDSPNLHEYIVKARSLSREATSSSDQRGGVGGGGSRFAFGSSTPRHLAHLDKIPTNQRVYDAKIPKKSSSNYDFKAQPIRYITSTSSNRNSSKSETRHVITSKDDDIASEPDLVQDRQEFLNEMREHKKSLEQQKAAADSRKMNAPTPPRKTQQQHAEQRDNPTSFNHAPEIAGNARKSIRIRAETQDDSAMAVENVSANKMNDQIEVSQLNEMVSETEIGGKEEAQNSKVTGDLVTQIMHKLPAEEIDTKIEETNQKVENLKNATIDEVSKPVDNSAKNAIQKSIDIISTDEEKLDDTTKRLNDLHTNAEKSAIEELKNKASNIADEKLIKLEEKTENVVNDIKKGLTSL